MNLCLAHGGDVSQPSGGTDRVTALAAGLQDRGFDVSLVVPEPVATLPDCLADVAVRSVETDRFGFSNALTRAETVASTARQVAAAQDAVLQLEHSTLAGVGTLRRASSAPAVTPHPAQPQPDGPYSQQSPPV